MLKKDKSQWNGSTRDSIVKLKKGKSSENAK